MSHRPRPRSIVIIMAELITSGQAALYYNVFGGTLNLAQSINQAAFQALLASFFGPAGV